MTERLAGKVEDARNIALMLAMLPVCYLGLSFAQGLAYGMMWVFVYLIWTIFRAVRFGLGLL